LFEGKKVMEVTVNLSENIYQSFKQLAEKTNRRIDEVVAEKIQTDYWAEKANGEQAISNLSDAEVLELANLKLSKQQDKRLSQLLENQRESRITTSEKVELDGLMVLYRMGTLRKAQGCLEAVRRGLIKTPADLK
jgi:predicted transcriptional regulator